MVIRPIFSLLQLLLEFVLLSWGAIFRKERVGTTDPVAQLENVGFEVISMFLGFFYGFLCGAVGQFLFLGLLQTIRGQPKASVAKLFDRNRCALHGAAVALRGADLTLLLRRCWCSFPLLRFVLAIIAATPFPKLPIETFLILSAILSVRRVLTGHRRRLRIFVARGLRFRSCSCFFPIFLLGLLVVGLAFLVFWALAFFFSFCLGLGRLLFAAFLAFFFFFFGRFRRLGSLVFAVLALLLFILLLTLLLLTLLFTLLLRCLFFNTLLWLRLSLRGAFFGFAFCLCWFGIGRRGCILRGDGLLSYADCSLFDGEVPV
mmetsp:Transcript_30576/g.65917  ORF Transcript_30576/g.65917 Transcript_30576/m.65917 type:complete len:317 (-) Transcript_30576:1702-2652(-)